MKHIIIIILTLLSISLQAQIRMNTKQSFVDSTRINATGDTAYYYQNGVLIGTKALAGTTYNNISENGDTVLISDHLKVNTNTLYVDATNNRVGIGTSSPQYFFDVNSYFNVDNTTFKTYVSKSTFPGLNTSYQSTSSTNFPIFGNSVAKIVADTLASYGSNRVGTTYLFYAHTGTANRTIASFGLRTGSNFSEADREGVLYFGTSDGTLTYPTEKMRIQANGNVGIGTTSPVSKLDVNGTVTATALNIVNDRNYYQRGSARLTSPANNANTLDINITNSVTRIFSNYYGGGADNPITIGTYANYTNQLVLATSGNVGIGTTSPDSKLEVNGSATNTNSINTSSDTIDFSLSNIAYTDNTGNSITLTNIKDGGAYTLISTATNVSSAVTFTASGFTIKYMGTVARTNGRQHIYSFIVADGNVYVTMGTEN